jgi:DNA-binding NtrC family response regulator
MRISDNRQILHIDDDPLITGIVRARLASRGYHCVPLNSAEEAIKILVSQQFRVVLLDLDMPGTSGLELLKQIKAFDGGIQVIVLTGLTATTSVLETLRTGAEACLFKPLLDFEPLVRTLDRTFEKLEGWWDALEDLSRRRRLAEPVR